MKNFLFITHLTPASLRSSLRQSLYEIHLESLKNQTCKSWKQFVVGEKEIRTDLYFEVAIDSSGTKQDRVNRIQQIFERPDVIDFITQSDYIIKLDDDDIISPTLLNDIKDKSFDLYYDEYHTFYDISSGCITQQKRPWVASTCVQKTEHAFSKLNKNDTDNFYQNSLFYCDHSKAWHVYYSDKCKISAPKNNPIYLRILSPTSITSGAKKFPIYSVDDIDFLFYYEYLKAFGYWNKTKVNIFNSYLPSLKTSWMSFTKMKQKPIPNIGIMNELLGKLNNYAKRTREIF